jgi:hypothetical protein
MESPLSEQALLEALQAGETLYRSEETRFAYLEGTEGPRLYINGQVVLVDGINPELVRLIADQRHYGPEELSTYLQGEDLAFLTGLCSQGYLGWLEGQE